MRFAPTLDPIARPPRILPPNTLPAPVTTKVDTSSSQGAVPTIPLLRHRSRHIVRRPLPFRIRVSQYTNLQRHSILIGAGGLVYANYIYHSYIIGAFHKFPEPVAVKLRRALYYTNISLSPKDAVKYYRQALEVADELGVDPFSDEILGVKIQLASLMEKIQQYPKAIEVLEIVKRDCLRWVEELGGKEGNEGKRTRVLGKTVGISVKLGELYANEYVMETEAAEEQLVWAVETVLKEKKRREDEGVKPGEGRWMTDEETGAALECMHTFPHPHRYSFEEATESSLLLLLALGHHYEQKNQHYLAAPLFLQALALIPQTDCHSVILSLSLPHPSRTLHLTPLPH